MYWTYHLIGGDFAVPVEQPIHPAVAEVERPGWCSVPIAEGWLGVSSLQLNVFGGYDFIQPLNSAVTDGLKTAFPPG